MHTEGTKKRIAILGAGPSGLFVYGRLLNAGRNDIEIHIFERKYQLGAGMPYSEEGANEEHVTNVSDNEIPHIATTIQEWIKTVPGSTLKHFGIDPSKFSEYKVLPRLLFGQYLSAQFDLLQEKAKKIGITTKLHLNCTIKDIADQPDKKEVRVETEENEFLNFDHVIICTGHNWPKKQEGKIPGYYDSPYPPSKLQLELNHPVAIKGSSLTAIDAIRTLARQNGTFINSNDDKLLYEPSESSPGFKLVLHSLNGLLPAIRFHLEDSHLSSDSLVSQEEIAVNREENEGFLSLDFIFEKDFKDKLKEKDPQFYERIKDMGIEEFVESMMELRKRLEPFQLFRAEYAEAEKSIKRHESVYWKEMLAVLSFAMNQPAKYFSAEDMLRLKKVLMPLISVVIAFVPQSSCKELFALHEAGKLDIVSVGPDSSIEPESKGGATYKFTDESKEEQSVYYKTFVDCVGQPHLSYDDFPFKSLIIKKTVSPGKIQFRSLEEGIKAKEKDDKNIVKDMNGKYYLKVSGLAINDNFQVLDEYGSANRRVFIMAVPYIGGYNPDYSGLDFCESASELVVNTILKF